MEVMDIGNFFTKVPKKLFDKYLAEVLDMIPKVSDKRKKKGGEWLWY